MNRGPVLTVALGVLLTLGACADDTSSLPTAETPAMLVGSGPACNPTALKKATEAFFGKRSAEVLIAGQFKPSTVNTPTVTGYAYQLFDAIEAKRDAAVAADAAFDVAGAATLSVEITACADLVFTDALLPGSGTALNDAYANALGIGGTYAVRGGTTYGYEPALSDDAQAGLQVPSGLATPALIIGHVPGSAPFGNEQYGGAQYDWVLVQPRNQTALNGLAAAALCVVNPPVDDSFLRLQHLPVAAGGNIIPYVPAAAAPPIQCGVVGSNGALGNRLLAALEAVILPKPLYAAVGSFGPVGGLLGSFSPVEAVNPDTIKLAFTTPPTDGEVNTPMPVAVTITAANGTPWEGVVVRLSAVANNGDPLLICDNEDETNADGVAEFPEFRVSKAGGLIVIASTIEPTTDVDVTAYSAVADSSDRINIRPATGTTLACP
jgi:hypothetical protein